MINKIRPEVLHSVIFIAISLVIVFIHRGHHVQSSLLQNITEINQRISFRRRRIQQHRRSPVLRVVLVRVELEEEFTDGVIEERLGNVSPLLTRSGEGEVDEDDDQTDHADEGFAKRGVSE